jgi:phycoerythrobilin:ferredoxin oxidoreductase
VDYLNYRKANDPARPMLTRLYGEEYTEKAISEVLFEMI